MEVVVVELRLAEGLPNVKKGAILLVVLLLAGAGVFAAWRWDLLSLVSQRGKNSADGAGQNSKNSSSARFDDHNVHALGRLEPAGGVLTIGALVGDRIEELEVKEGDTITAGKTIATLASRSMRQLEYEAVRAQIKEATDRRAAETEAADARINIAKLNLKKAQSSQAEIEAQTKQVALAESNVELAKKDLTRMEGLPTPLISKQELERQRLLVQKAEAELAAASAALGTLEESSLFAEEGAQADLDAAEAAKQQVINSIAVVSLEKKAELAQIQLEETEITAPADGTVLRVFTRKGEIISNKPILQMADLGDLICVAEVYEGDLPNVRVGQHAEVASQAFPRSGKVRGRVSRIGGMISTPELRSLDPFAPTDRHVVEVEIRFEEAIPKEARLANLQVEVTILSSSDEGADEDSPGVAQSRP
jgi:HlyD family secretion protein